MKDCVSIIKINMNKEWYKKSTAATVGNMVCGGVKTCETEKINREVNEWKLIFHFVL